MSIKIALAVEHWLGVQYSNGQPV